MTRFVKLARLDDLPPGSAREFEVEGRIVALFHADGVISAIDGICAHQGGPLAGGAVQGTVVSCPWHGWPYDVRTGQSRIHAGIRQAVFEVKLEGEDILVGLP